MCPTFTETSCCISLAKTEAIGNILKRAAGNQNLNQELRNTARAYGKQQDVPWQVLRQLSAALSAVEASEATAPLRLHELCQGSKLIVPAVPKREKSEELKAILAQRQRLVEERQYAEMVKDISKREIADAAARSTLLGTYRSQITFGVHILTMMATFFAGGWFGAGVLSINVAVKAGCGCIGMLLAMLLETTLYIVRSEATQRSVPEVLKRKMDHVREHKGDKTKILSASKEKKTN